MNKIGCYHDSTLTDECDKKKLSFPPPPYFTTAAMGVSPYQTSFMLKEEQKPQFTAVFLKNTKAETS